MMNQKTLYTLSIIISLYTIQSCEDSDNNENTIADIDGNVYQTIIIGNQTWIAENLMVRRYRNGDEIPNVTNDVNWQDLSIGAYCDYENDPNNSETFGRLYNWFSIYDDRSIAPEGWHIPIDEEWKQLEMYLGLTQTEADNAYWSGTNEGGKIKTTGTKHWDFPNKGATNESGFSALPGGYREWDNGGFYSIGKLGQFWTISESDSNTAWCRVLYNSQSTIGRFSGYKKQTGISVRCVKNN